MWDINIVNRPLLLGVIPSLNQASYTSLWIMLNECTDFIAYTCGLELRIDPISDSVGFHDSVAFSKANIVNLLNLESPA